MDTESAKVSGGIDSHDAVVVGARSAGLAAAAALQKRGFETVVLECSGAVGARWRSRYEELRPDAVICATGYRRGLEPLVGHLGVLRPNGVPVRLPRSPEHPAAPRLYFAGMWGQFSGEIRLGPIHARRITRAAARHRAHHDNEQKRPEGAERYRRVKLRSGH